MLYFAYAVNMDEETLGERGVQFSKVCIGKVRNVRLVFHKPGENGTGKADLQDHRGSLVEGVVYEVPEASLANLDVYEGVEKGHYRRQVVKVQTSRGELECMVYRAAKFKMGLKPSRSYLERILRGAKAHRLSGDYLAYLNTFDTVPDKG